MSTQLIPRLEGDLVPGALGKTLFSVMIPDSGSVALDPLGDPIRITVGGGDTVEFTISEQKAGVIRRHVEFTILCDGTSRGETIRFRRSGFSSAHTALLYSVTTWNEYRKTVKR